jgi:hypothetical protein
MPIILSKYPDVSGHKIQRCRYIVLHHIATYTYHMTFRDRLKIRKSEIMIIIGYNDLETEQQVIDVFDYNELSREGFKI